MPGHPDPLHGVTLEKLLTELVAHHGWAELGKRVDIRCFRNDPSIKSSLAFLRKTPWPGKRSRRSTSSSNATKAEG